jgi:hypothetical protein
VLLSDRVIEATDGIDTAQTNLHRGLVDADKEENRRIKKALKFLNLALAELETIQ